MYEGSCLCGTIRYEISGPIGPFGHCHCTSCRKASGTAFATNAPVERSAFRLVDAAGALREFESSPGKFRVFCSQCGSPIYAYLKAAPDVVRIRLGTLDTPFHELPRAHTFVGEKADWHRILDALPQFERWATRDVLHQRGSKQGLE